MPVIIKNSKIVLPSHRSLVTGLEKPIIGDTYQVHTLIETFDQIRVIAELKAIIDPERLVNYSSRRSGALSGGKVSYSFEELKEFAKKFKISYGVNKADVLAKIKEILYEEK